VRISDKAVNNFQQIYLKKFGESISEDQALEKAIKLVSLINVIRKYENNSCTRCNVNSKEIKNDNN
jgi:hypothetical protein